VDDSRANERGDSYLDERLARYDRWIDEGRLPFSSRVIPVRESVAAQQWVLPTEQAVELLRNARSFALANCACRSRYGRCDNPLEVCFFVNDVADKLLAEGTARRVSLEEAIDRLRLANELGLVHLTIYNPAQYVYALCSCCTCCCHDMQFLQAYGRSDLIAHSEYVAQTDMDRCVHCGDCIERCVFGARTWQDGKMHYDVDACYGCGLCVTVCSVDATSMELERKTTKDVVERSFKKPGAANDRTT
jgi:Pyruvate/2-oxoacid:ferredoxin oxidoreductase delta subunit